MSFKFPLMPGSTLLIGEEQQMQSTVVRHVAGNWLAKGRKVFNFVSDKLDMAGDALHMRDWLQAHDVDPAALANFIPVLPVSSKYEVTDQLVEEDQPLVIRDLGRSTKRLIAGDVWLNAAMELARKLRIAVLTAGQYGPHGPPAPKLHEYVADEIWQCKAGLNLSLTLQQFRPGKRVVKFTGKDMPANVIGLSNVDPDDVLLDAALH